MHPANPAPDRTGRRLLTESCWLRLGDVDATPLIDWLAAGRDWPQPRKEQPQRLRLPAIARPVIDQVLRYFADPVACNVATACLSRVLPGQGHGYHQDPQAPNWLTRVHVPILTNPLAWMAFESEGGWRVHFAVGGAYAFNALRRHAFRNDGPTARVHLLFDVLEIPCNRS